MAQLVNPKAAKMISPISMRLVVPLPTPLHALGLQTT